MYENGQQLAKVSTRDLAMNDDNERFMLTYRETFRIPAVILFPHWHLCMAMYRSDHQFISTKVETDPAEPATSMLTVSLGNTPIFYISNESGIHVTALNDL
jgi:hypothetical protein